MRFPAALLLSLFVPCLEGMLQCAAEEGETPPKQFLADRKGKGTIAAMGHPDSYFWRTTSLDRL